MDFGDQVDLEHILFSERKCRVCGKIKNLVDDFYLTRKNRVVFPSAYSYECKECTKERILRKRKYKKPKTDFFKWEYPDW